jgi:hypothetical protein
LSRISSENISHSFEMEILDLKFSLAFSNIEITSEKSL